MRKRLCFILAILLLALGAFCGCGTEKGSFCGFGEPFVADVEGEWNGVRFSAEICGEEKGENGVLPLTVTFYAPEALCGTSLCRTAAGEVQLSSGALSLPVKASFSPLFDLFAADTVNGAVTLLDGGMTAVDAAGVRYLLLPDDTLFRIEAENGFLNVKSLRFASAETAFTDTLSD